MASVIEDWLEENGIDFSPAGKNVGPNDVNVQCPFCDDDKYHLGIHKEKGYLNCWKCRFEHLQKKPWLGTLFQELLQCDYYTARKEAKEVLAQMEAGESREESWVRTSETELPGFCHPFFEELSNPNQILSHRMAYQYLKARRISPSTIQDRKIMYTELWAQGRPHDPLSGRIIVPFFGEGGEVLTWLGRDYTGYEMRYRNCPVEFSTVRFKETLYNLAGFKRKALKKARIVEGVFDALEIGDSALAVSKGGISLQQLKLIRELGLEELSIIFDPWTSRDPFSIARAFEAAKNLSPFIRRIKIVQLKEGDVNEIGWPEVLKAENKTHYHLF